MTIPVSLRSKLRPLVLIFLVIGTLAGLIAALKRFQVEDRNRRVEIAVEWQEITTLSQTSGQPAAAILARFKAEQVSTLIIQEDTIAGLEVSGGIKRPDSV